MTVVMSEACGRQMDGLNRRGNRATVARRGKLMAVEIKATPTAFDRGAPQALFDLRSIILPPNTGSTGYAPAPDGKRFLVATAPGVAADAPPLTVVVNWLASLKK